MTASIEINGLQQLKLLSAFHALGMPEGTYGVSHKQARDAIKSVVGYCPADKPIGSTWSDCVRWLALREATPCDGCGADIEPDKHHTDDEVCGGGDGPGFFLCGECTPHDLSVIQRHMRYAAQRALNEAR